MLELQVCSPGTEHWVVHTPDKNTLTELQPQAPVDLLEATL